MCGSSVCDAGKAAKRLRMYDLNHTLDIADVLKYKHASTHLIVWFLSTSHHTQWNGSQYECHKASEERPIHRPNGAAVNSCKSRLQFTSFSIKLSQETQLAAISEHYLYSEAAHGFKVVGLDSLVSVTPFVYIETCMTQACACKRRLQASQQHCAKTVTRQVPTIASRATRQILYTSTQVYEHFAGCVFPLRLRTQVPMSVW